MPTFKVGDIIKIVDDRIPNNLRWPRPPLGARARFIGPGDVGDFIDVVWLDRDGWDVQDGIGWSANRFALAEPETVPW